MKKIIALLLAAAMLLSMTACGGSAEPAETAPATTELAVVETEAPTEAPTEALTEAPTEAQNDAPAVETAEGPTTTPETDTPAKGGCGAVLGMTMLPCLITIAFVCRKRRED